MHASAQRLRVLRDRYARLVGMRDQLASHIRMTQDTIETYREYACNISAAKTVIQEIANQAREQFKCEVDRLVTLAIRSVFNEAFTFDLQMITKGGRLQCTPVVWEQCNNRHIEYNPKDDLGGSILDPIGFALRIVLHQFQRRPSRSVFLLDEPMKHLGHGELLDQAGTLLTEISHKLRVQLIIITHEPELMRIADRAWIVTRDPAGVSTVSHTDSDHVSYLSA